MSAENEKSGKQGDTKSSECTVRVDLLISSPSLDGVVRRALSKSNLTETEEATTIRKSGVAIKEKLKSINGDLKSIYERIESLPKLQEEVIELPSALMADEEVYLVGLNTNSEIHDLLDSRDRVITSKLEEGLIMI